MSDRVVEKLWTPIFNIDFLKDQNTNKGVLKDKFGVLFISTGKGLNITRKTMFSKME